MNTSRVAVTAVLLLMSLSGCVRSAKVVQSVQGAFDGDRTYAWTAKPPEAGRLGAPAGQEDVAAALRSALESEFRAKGFEKTSPGDAKFLAAVYLGVEKDTRSPDPLFTGYSAERIERGHAVLTLSDTAIDEVARTATVTRVLRVTDRGRGQMELRWEPTNHRRDWEVPQLAAELGKSLPE